MVTSIDVEVAKFIIWVLYFVGLYFSLFWLSVLISDSSPNKKIKIKDWPEVSIIMPMWNEEDNIGPTIKSLAKLDYPKDKLHLIVVDDGSTDDSLKVAKSLQKKYDFKLITQKNGGKHTAVNHGLKYVKTPFFACLDVDGYVDKKAMKHIMSEFHNENVAAVMPIMKVAEINNLLQRTQWLEYILNNFYKFIMAKLHCVHVTPGPLSTYRTKIVNKLGNFKNAHGTEDLEIALRLQNNHYEIKQSIDAVIYTKCPPTVKSLISQRTRWYQGTTLNVIDYKHLLFNKEYGEFGLFHMPLVAVTGFLSFAGIFVITYLFLKQLYHMVKSWYLTGFDFPTYISTFFSYHSTWLDLNYLTLITNFILLGTVFISIWLAFFYVNEKTGFGKNFKATLTFIFYFFGYNFIIGYVWLKVFYRVIFRKANKWEKVN